MPRKQTITDETIISALLSCPTLEAAAQKCGLSVRQLFDRRKNAEFVQKLTEAQTAALGDTCRYLQHSTGTAAQTLVEIASSPNRPPQVRIAAARTILEQAAKFTETVDVVERLERLERDEEIRGVDIE